MTLGDLIKKYRTNNHISMDKFAEHSGLSKGYISMLEKNMNPQTGAEITPSLQTIKQASSAMGMDFEKVLSLIDQDIELTSPDSDIFNHPDILPITKKKFPLIGGIACGEPVYQEEDYETTIIANGDINADFAMRCYGDSMINIGIKDGYIVFIRKQPKVENGEVAAVNIDGEFTLKRFYDYGNIIVLRSENPAPEYKDLEYRENDANNIIILGKAVAFQGDIK